MGRSYTSKPVKLEPITLDGVTFEPLYVSVMEVAELARMGAEDMGSAKGYAALAVFFERLFGEAEYARFRDHCHAHNTDDDTLQEIVRDVVEASTARPTQRPSALPDGPPTTEPMLKVVSASGEVSWRPVTSLTREELQALVQAATADPATAAQPQTPTQPQTPGSPPES